MNRTGMLNEKLNDRYKMNTMPSLKNLRDYLQIRSLNILMRKSLKRIWHWHWVRKHYLRTKPKQCSLWSIHLMHFIMSGWKQIYPIWIYSVTLLTTMLNQQSKKWKWKIKNDKQQEVWYYINFLFVYLEWRNYEKKKYRSYYKTE